MLDLIVASGVDFDCGFCIWDSVLMLCLIYDFEFGVDLEVWFWV